MNIYIYMYIIYILFIYNIYIYIHILSIHIFKASAVGTSLDADGLRAAHALLAEALPLTTMPSRAHQGDMFHRLTNSCQSSCLNRYICTHMHGGC